MQKKSLSKTSMFATVEVVPGRMTVCVLKPSPAPGEFSALVRECERLYTSQTEHFVLALNLCAMESLHPFDALQWMAMFVRVLPTTRAWLVCTCVCFHPVLREAIDMFLRHYDPIKPFHVFDRYDDWMEAMDANRIVADMQ